MMTNNSQQACLPKTTTDQSQQYITRTQLSTNPYPLYDQLRSQAAFAQVAGMLPNMKHSQVITRYETVATLLRDPRMSSDPSLTDSWFDVTRALWLPKALRCITTSMISKDGVEHKRLRSLAAKAFTPNLIRALEPRIIEVTDQCLDNMQALSQVDLFQAFALKIPLAVISDMLGVAEEERDEFHQLSTQVIYRPLNSLSNVIIQTPALLRLQRYFERLIQRKKHNPANDFASALIHAEEEGYTLNDEELVGMFFLLLFAGHETTANLISNGTLALLQHPDQLASFKAEPQLVHSMIDEMLRYTNPVQHTLPRIATETINIDGKLLHKGETALLFIAAANRDPSVFDRPDQFDIRRSPNKHLGFGYGVHFCLGAPLARLEASIAFPRLFERFPAMRLAVPSDQLRWRDSMFLRGLHTLPIELQP